MKNIVENQDIKTDKAEIDSLRNQLAAVVAENAALKSIIDSVTDINNEPEYHDCGMGCGLEDRGITDRYEAMSYGWDQAMERIYSEVIPSAEELNIETPATDAAVREIEARGVEKFADFCSTANNGHEIHPDIEEIRMFAAELREGTDK